MEWYAFQGVHCVAPALPPRSSISPPPHSAPSPPPVGPDAGFSLLTYTASQLFQRLPTRHVLLVRDATGCSVFSGPASHRFASSSARSRQFDILGQLASEVVLDAPCCVPLIRSWTSRSTDSDCVAVRRTLLLHWRVLHEIALHCIQLFALKRSKVVTASEL